jgi:hypothetical protein
MRVAPLPKDVWSLILVKYLDIHSLHHMYDISQSMRQYYRENQIWRKRVPIDILGYWDQCGLTDPYRLLLAISAIGKIELILPWKNDTRAEMLVDEENDAFGIPKCTDSVFMFDKERRIGAYIKPTTNVVATTYHLLGMRCTRIVYYTCPTLQCGFCNSCILPCTCN